MRAKWYIFFDMLLACVGLYFLYSCVFGGLSLGYGLVLFFLTTTLVVLQIFVLRDLRTFDRWGMVTIDVEGIVATEPGTTVRFWSFFQKKKISGEITVYAIVNGVATVLCRQDDEIYQVSAIVAAEEYFYGINRMMLEREQAQHQPILESLWELFPQSIGFLKTETASLSRSRLIGVKHQQGW